MAGLLTLLTSRSPCPGTTPRDYTIGTSGHLDTPRNQHNFAWDTVSYTELPDSPTAQKLPPGHLPAVLAFAPPCPSN